MKTINWLQILEGWRNKLIPPEELKTLIEATSKERMGICNACKFNSINKPKKYIRPDIFCSICGCTLSAKTACLSCECPVDKWSKVLTEEEEEQLNEK